MASRSLLLLSLLALFCLQLHAQRPVSATDSFSIEGLIKKNIRFHTSQAAGFRSISLPDVELKNHKGENKKTLRGLKGFPLKQLLDSLEFVYEKPRELDRFYFSFIGSDGYHVVFSWHELFNTLVGEQLYLITEIDGRPLARHEERILLLSMADFDKGPRLVKGLTKILVRRAE